MTTAVPGVPLQVRELRAKAEETAEQEACLTGNQAPAIFSLTCTGRECSRFRAARSAHHPGILDEAQSRLVFWDSATAHAAAVRTMQDFP